MYTKFFQQHHSLIHGRFIDFELDLKQGIPKPLRSDYEIDAGFNVAAITSRTPERAREVAELRGIPRVRHSG